MRPDLIRYLGYLAGTMTVLAFLPQVIRTWKTRRTGDLSMGMFAIIITASALWVVYGAVMSDLPIILTNVGMIALNGALAVAKVRYR